MEVNSQWALVQVGLMVTQDQHRNCTKIVQFLCWILCNHQIHLYQCSLWMGSGAYTGLTQKLHENLAISMLILCNHEDQHRNCTKIVQFLCWILYNHQTHLYQCPLWMGSGAYTGLTQKLHENRAISMLILCNHETYLYQCPLWMDLHNFFLLWRSIHNGHWYK